MKLKTKLIIIISLLFLFILFYLLFKMNFNNQKLLIYQIKSRSIKILCIVISGFLIGFASIVFQTITNNRVITPALLGMNGIYTLINTLIVFFIGTSSIFFINKNINFFLNLSIMVLVSYLVYGLMFKKTKYNILYILLIGTVLTSLFSSLQNSMIRILDPNEYDTLLSNITASFENINTEIIIFSIILLIIIMFIFIKELKNLNVISLGKDMAINLGINYDLHIKKLLIFVALFIGISTALVGPISFLGLISTNITRQIFKTYKHKYLIFCSVIISIIILVIGQFITERLFLNTIPISVFITILGGLYFLIIIFRSRKEGI